MPKRTPIASCFPVLFWPSFPFFVLPCDAILLPLAQNRCSHTHNPTKEWNQDQIPPFPPHSAQTHFHPLLPAVDPPCSASTSPITKQKKIEDIPIRHAFRPPTDEMIKTKNQTSENRVGWCYNSVRGRYCQHSSWLAFISAYLLEMDHFRVYDRYAAPKVESAL